MTLFTKIAKGEIPSYKVAENEDFYAFLDINPMTKGHTLVIPRNTEEDYIFRLDDETYTGLMQFSRQVAIAIEKSIPCKRIAIAVMGMEVPHTHVHLIPINKESEMNIANPKLKLDSDEMAAIAAKINEQFNSH
ncbi:MAG: HIT family protein [Kaistella sp.]|jgi:histidine triad (HIT) family protein|nr:HIT family protein [Kaistella sp.]